VEQPATHAEVLTMNTSTLNIQPPFQHQDIETQDPEEEIEAIIDDELAYLDQENERLCLMEEHLARRKAMAKRSLVVQQQIEQKRATQADLQRAIEGLRWQEQESSMQEPPLQQQQPHQPPHQGMPQQQWRQMQGTIDSKCPLTDSLQLAPWPPQSSTPAKILWRV
jgi:hypothetical protein